MADLRTHDIPDGIEPNDWTLRVTGAVSRTLHIERTELTEFPNKTVTDDFTCVEGWVAKDLSWRGVVVGSILNRAEPTVDNGYVLVHSMDGDYACSFRRNRVKDALLAFELDGDRLPVEHGGPARLVPTDVDSDCWESVKWVSEFEVTETDPVAGDTAEEIATGRLD